MGLRLHKTSAWPCLAVAYRNRSTFCASLYTAALSYWAIFTVIALWQLSDTSWFGASLRWAKSSRLAALGCGVPLNLLSCPNWPPGGALNDDLCFAGDRIYEAAGWHHLVVMHPLGRVATNFVTKEDQSWQWRQWHFLWYSIRLWLFPLLPR